ncbi:MAG: S8 family serine peptidase [Flavobacteriales bacterium]|nr:S8 family serine peptidase [Flavobacteriales bacterium]
MKKHALNLILGPLITILLLATVVHHVHAQQLVDKYWVVFTDKPNVEFDPYSYFDAKAIERRLKHKISLTAESDLPVSEHYIQSVQEKVEEVRVVSRWFNAVCVLASRDQIREVEKLPFVRSTELMQPTTVLVSGIRKSTDEWAMNENAIEYAHAQLDRMQGRQFQENNIDGKGVRVAVFDIGFKSYKTNPAFEHLRKNDQILKTWDFVKKRENVDGYNSHGTLVLSCIAGKLEDNLLGLAQGAEFLLARTETWTEFYSEEENWLAAAEWADKEGADIINSSLGYTHHRYFREQMNGKTSLVSRAANMAASKGILVVNAAGNEGADNWKFIGTPADADSVLSIGGIEPYTGYHTSFSSFGPTSDKRLKPNVCAYGHVVGSGPDGVEETQGTSFSSPLVAGFAACALQTRPAFTNMQLFDDIQKSGDLYPYFDYAHGYGVPRASYFLRALPTVQPTLEFIDKGSYVQIRILENSTEPLGDTTKKNWFSRSTEWPDIVFYHVENRKGYLDKYWLVDPKDRMKNMSGDSVDEDAAEPVQQSNDPLIEFAEESPFNIKKSAHQKPFIIRAWYRGYTGTYQVN